MNQNKIVGESSLSRRTFLGAVGATALAVAASKVLPAGAQTDSRLVGTSPGAFLLSDGWTIQAASAVPEKGDVVSKSDYSPSGKWYAATVPTTVLAALAANGEYSGKDIFYGENLKKAADERARFAGAWWYRKSFDLPASASGQQVWLYFKGINYRANVWLNGKQIGTSDKVVGCYRDVELNITSAINAGGSNALAVEVFPPAAPGAGRRGGAAGGGEGGGGGGSPDLTITFVDWAPNVPDLNMGLWQDVIVQTSGSVALRHSHVVTDLDIPKNATARLTVMADLTNPTANPVTATLDGSIEQIKFSQQVTLAPGETKTVTFTPEQFPQLVISNPRIWWPYQLGAQDRYDLNLSASVEGKVSDSATTRFGVRKVTSRMIDEPIKADREGDASKQVLYSVNGVDMLILGGGYAPDLLQRRTFPDRLTWQEDHIRYVRDMGLNTVRLEGKLEDDAFFDICDRYGVLVLAGWCCCSAWERWNNWQPEQHSVALASLTYQIQKLRTHPCMLVWLNGSDNPPPANIEREYLAIEKTLAWPNPTTSSATRKVTTVTPQSGVKMEGPYQWEPPAFWLTDKTTGGAWGFNTEVGPGPVPPPIESIEKMLPAANRWPVNEMWNFHCGYGNFGNIGEFQKWQDTRFGPSTSLADFTWKAQAQAYETLKAMYEGFRRNKYTKATGEIQWMLNNAWPSMIWHLYDYYWRPGAAYAAVKSGCEIVHVMYSYDNGEINVVNDGPKAMANLTVTATIYDIDAKQKYNNTATVTSPENSSVVAFTLPKLPADISTTYFLRLTIADADKKQVSVNSYWLSITPDVLDFAHSSWWYTPPTSGCDYTALQKLPKVKLDLDNFTVKPMNDEQQASVRVTNNSQAIALLVRLKLTKGAGGEEVLPIRWEDNYFMLLPGEQRQISARYLNADLGSPTPVVDVDCFNNGRA